MPEQSMTPDWKFIAYPASNAAQRRRDGFTVADIFRDMLPAANSDYAGQLAQESWNNYTRLASGLEVEGAGFMAFLPDNTISRKPASLSTAAYGAGLFVLPVKTPQPPDFEELDGTWKQVPQLTAKGGSGVYNTGSEETQRARLGRIEKNQPIECDMSFLTQQRTGTRPEYLKRLGPKLRLALREGLPPSLESLDSPSEEGAETWGTYRTMDKYGPFSFRESSVTMRLYHLGDRAIWEMGDQGMWILDSKETKGLTKTTPKTVEPKKLEWGGIQPLIEATNCRARVEMASLSYGTAIVRRTVPRPAVEDQVETAPIAGGHYPQGTKMGVNVSRNERSTTYEITLNSSPDGRSTPLLSQVSQHWKPLWSDQLSTGGVDVTKAVTGCSINQAYPPMQAGFEGTIEFDVTLLKKFVAGYASVLHDESPIEISATWRDNTGALMGAHDGLFRGYLLGTTSDETDWNKATITFQLRDSIARLQGTLAPVDGRAPNLDRILAERMLAQADANAGEPKQTGYVPDGAGGVKPLTTRQKQLFGADAAKELVGHYLGPFEENSFNGNGDALRFTPAAQPPLFDKGDYQGSWLAIAGVYGTELTSGKFIPQAGTRFPPPYGQDALTWINNFAADCNSIFFYGYPDRETQSWPCPVFMEYSSYLGRVKVWEVEGGALDSINIETKPESNITRVLVWGNPFGTSANPGTPAFVQGEAVERPARWERTKILETNLASTEERAKFMAAVFLNEAYEEDGIEWPKYTRRGNSKMQVADIVFTVASNHLNVNGKFYRIGRLEHRYEVGAATGAEWHTTASLQTLTEMQRAAYNRAHPEIGGQI